MKSINREDYLRAMFCINESSEGTIKSIEIANRLNVSKPAASEMLKKLKTDGYIEMPPYSNIKLTKKGLKEARKITYRHRIAESFMHNILKINKRDLHKEAHRLEHSLSDKVVKKMAKILRNPKVCPCGHVIPKP